MQMALNRLYCNGISFVKPVASKMKFRIMFAFATYYHLAMKVLYILLGFLALVLGIIGIILPGLPTTPFLLVALFCFSKSSPRLQAWFMTTQIYQKYLKDYDQKRAMTMRQKITILAISAPFCLFAFFSLPHIAGKLVLVAVVVVQYWYFFFKIKTLPATVVVKS